MISLLKRRNKLIAISHRTMRNSFRCEVICTTCKARGQLWFNSKYKIEAHKCPNSSCQKRTLKTPHWLNIYTRSATKFKI